MTIKGITIKWPVWVIILLIVGFGMYKFAPKVLGKMGFSNTTRTIAINPWSPYGAMLRMNGGMDYDATSRAATEFNLKAQFKRFDKRDAAIAALDAGAIDACWVTVDIMPTELFEYSTLSKVGVELIAITDISRGADVIVADRTIKTVQDFKGKQVAYTDASASLTLLIYLLETANMTLDDIIPVRVASGVEAAQMFLDRKVPIAAVWSPDDGDCLEAIEGSTRFFGTDKARNIVMDGLLVRKDDLKNPEFRTWATNLVAAWLVGNAECNESESAKQEAAVLFDKAFTGYGVDIALAGLNGVRLTTYQDNVNLFGMNREFTGVTGEKVYNNMARIYSKVPDTKGSVLAKNPLAWREVSNENIIKEITTLTGREHLAEPDILKFNPLETAEAQAEAATAIPVVSIKVIINFPFNSAELDDYAKTALDAQVINKAQELSGFRMRVEGNSDKVGSQTASGEQYNKELSKRRAQAVINYLTKAGNFDANRFVAPIGWGSSNPIYPNEVNAVEAAANRRTEVIFIN